MFSDSLATSFLLAESDMDMDMDMQTPVAASGGVLTVWELKRGDETRFRRFRRFVLRENRHANAGTERLG
jgi:hypothetical protein